MKYRFRGATSVAVLACLTFTGAACADLGQPEDDLPLGVATQSIGCPSCGTDEIPTQGEFLFGASIDNVLPGDVGEMFSVKLDAIHNALSVDVSFLGQGALSLDGGATVFTGAGLLMTPTAGSGQLRVSFVEGGADWAYYYLEWAETSAGPFTELCGGDVAFPIYHSFSTSGTHKRPAQGTPSDRISWTCADGVALKCAYWGYPGGGEPSLDPESMWQLHAACTRMARADRCETGTSHTREGTEIRIFDRVGIREVPPDVFQGLSQWPPPVNQWSYESAWVSGDFPTDTHAAKCTNHLRWSSLPDDGGCDIPLPDPRTDTSATACDDIFGSPGQLKTNENLLLLDNWMFTNRVSLLQASHWNELPLMPWINGNDRVMTIDGYIDIDTIKRPYSASYNPEPTTFVAPVLDGTLVRKQTASMVGFTEQVFLYIRNSTDRVLMTQTMVNSLPNAADFIPQTPAKGWIFTVDEFQDIELVAVHLYKKAFLGTDYTSTTVANRPSGYGIDLGIIGYIPAIEAAE